MAAPDIKVRGIRGPMPSGYVLGRQSAGSGPPELIDISSITNPAPGKVTSVFGRLGAIVAAADDYATGQLTCSSAADSASAGRLGEYLETEVLQAAAVALNNGTPTDIVTRSLTAGDWDVWGNLVWLISGGTGTNQGFAWLSATSVTLPTIPNKGAITNPVVVANFMAASVGMRRFSLASTTTIYLSTQTNYSGGSTISGFGFIGARRVR